MGKRKSFFQFNKKKIKNQQKEETTTKKNVQTEIILKKSKSNHQKASNLSSKDIIQNIVKKDAEIVEKNVCENVNIIEPKKEVDKYSNTNTIATFDDDKNENDATEENNEFDCNTTDISDSTKSSENIQEKNDNKEVIQKDIDTTKNKNDLLKRIIALRCNEKTNLEFELCGQNGNERNRLWRKIVVNLQNQQSENGESETPIDLIRVQNIFYSFMSSYRKKVKDIRNGKTGRKWSYYDICKEVAPSLLKNMENVKENTNVSQEKVKQLDDNFRYALTNIPTFSDESSSVILKTFNERDSLIRSILHMDEVDDEIAIKISIKDTQIRNMGENERKAVRKQVRKNLFNM